MRVAAPAARPPIRLFSAAAAAARFGGAPRGGGAPPRGGGAAFGGGRELRGGGGGGAGVQNLQLRRHSRDMKFSFRWHSPLFAHVSHLASSSLHSAAAFVLPPHHPHDRAQVCAMNLRFRSHCLSATHAAQSPTRSSQRPPPAAGTASAAAAAAPSQKPHARGHCSRIKSGFDEHSPSFAHSVQSDCASAQLALSGCTEPSALHQSHANGHCSRINLPFAVHSPEAAHRLQSALRSWHAPHSPHARLHEARIKSGFFEHCPSSAHSVHVPWSSTHVSAAAARPAPGCRARSHQPHERTHSNFIKSAFFAQSPLRIHGSQTAEASMQRARMRMSLALTTLWMSSDVFSEIVFPLRSISSAWSVCER